MPSLLLRLPFLVLLLGPLLLPLDLLHCLADRRPHLALDTLTAQLALCGQVVVVGVSFFNTLRAEPSHPSGYW